MRPYDEFACRGSNRHVAAARVIPGTFVPDGPVVGMYRCHLCFRVVPIIRSEADTRTVIEHNMKGEYDDVSSVDTVRMRPGNGRRVSRASEGVKSVGRDVPKGTEIPF